MLRLHRPLLPLAALLTGCVSDAPRGSTPQDPAIEAPPAAPSAGAFADPAGTAPGEMGVVAARRAELRGAPYERETAGELAVLVPRELAGAEADDRARRAFAALDEAERREVIEWFDSECKHLGTFQASLVAHVIEDEPRSADSWPELERLRWFDPVVHAPAQPIPRVPLAADSMEVVAVRNRVLGAIAARRVDSGWMYDYATRELRRLPRQADPMRVFENGLSGMPPDWDLAEALVERALDDGELQKSFTAFAHAYTDRWGGVYPGVTLYDAHASLTQIEMPDVDALGLIHEITGDFETWKSVVPTEQQDSLYRKIGELFTATFRYRSTRTNLARAYLCGNAELRDSFVHNLDNFHALWESAHSEPAELAAKLPDASGSWEFLQSWHDHLVATPEEFYRGTNRHAALDRDAQRTRQRLFWVLDQFGAFARIESFPKFDQ